MIKRFASLVILALPLLVAANTCSATEQLLYRALKSDTQISHQLLDWQLDVDFALHGDEAQKIQVRYRGQTAKMAAALIELTRTAGQLTSIEPDDMPVAIFCRNEVVVVARQVQISHYLSQGCITP
ncbi:hypothetical protein IFT48_01980 [Pseudomonas fluorescens]|uniref:hypothetical protein n=1 Tax=Pseudomonas TaxID=286 RepID=UPI000F023F86|nr:MULTISPECIES: hypothetical protein [Pseudomonas]MBD8088731.1 hypothetical protein [Pseudomonas fluorescens]MBD8681508.1 hypothetical protein [Pseudomonas sp. CFBP 13719]